MRFWLRWFGGRPGDARPVRYPSPVEWWCTGERDADPPNVICGVVDAPSPTAAWELVRRDWPEYEPDGCEARPAYWRPDPGRFPPRTTEP